MFRDQLDLRKIMKAIEAAYRRLDEEELPQEAKDQLQEAMENSKQAMHFLFTPIKK